MTALSIKNLTKTYANGFEALKNIDLELADGEFFALLGANGAGKSTIIGIICSLINKSSGELSVFGHNLATHPSEAKSLLGVVPQEFNFNVFEPVIEVLVNQAGFYGIKRAVAFERAEVLLKKLKLWDKRRDMGRELSGGMKRRLMIARSLMHQPKLLILDEPTAGVDIEIRRSMWAFLKELNEQGTTIILTTHYLEEAEQLCKRIAIINQGEIIKHCDMAELLQEVELQCLSLDLKQPLSKVPDIEGLICHLASPLSLEIEIEKSVSLNQVFELLSKNNIEVTNVRNKSNRLEQMFLELIADNESTDLNSSGLNSNGLEKNS